MRDSRRRSGSALIEVLISVVLIATAGIALVTLLGQTARTLRDVVTTEQLTRQAEEELDKLVLLNRAALLGRLGTSHLRDLSIRIDELAPGLFDASVAATDTSESLLSTTLYRPDSLDAAR
jgi:type II secretory pathway pseudopilin PulG